MRSILSTLFMILLLGAIVLVGATVAAFGIGAVGWLVHRVFGLTQWQGSLIALGSVLGVGYLMYQFGGPPAPVITRGPDWVDWDDDDLDDEDETPEPPVVAWRQRRPTPGQLPTDKTPNRKARGGRGSTRK